MSDFSMDHFYYKTQISNSNFFSDTELINCLSEINNNFNFHSNLSYNNSADPLTFPEDKCPPCFARSSVQKMSPVIQACQENSSGTSRIDQNLGRGKEKEIVHVRAKRGQATDRHSLAERVRREKINERLRCLQDIVPGCNKTMGMAVMLDEIINYVQSLQNQVEFLSMKLAVASSYYEFSSEADKVEARQTDRRYGKQ